MGRVTERKSVHADVNNATENMTLGVEGGKDVVLGPKPMTLSPFS
jgi:hypothetical protein